ncbi:MAG: SDR family NAD(P)-dependent oxidoreductase, partial [Chloroflexota bacterium]
MDLGLKDRVYLVAASSKGLGYGVAKALAGESAKVSMCSRTQADIEAAAKTLADETGAETMATECDVTNPDDINAWVSKTVEAWGRIDGLLVNAGGPPAKPFKETTD